MSTVSVLATTFQLASTALTVTANTAPAVRVLCVPVLPVDVRFRYLYDRTELEEWVPRITHVAEQADTTHVVMNNCYSNYGTTNALEIAALIRDAYEAAGPRLAE